MRIALCDDQPEALQLLKNQVLSWPQADQLVVVTYSSGKELWFNLEDRDIADVFILDIEMPEFDGISLAEIIRRKNPHALIIFYTAYVEYAIRGYQVDAIRYIVKGTGTEALYEALDAAFTRYQALQQKSIVLTYHHISTRVLYSDILYVERNHRQIVLHTVSGAVYVENGGLQEFYDTLHDARFFFIDRGIFVNLDYVARIEANQLLLTTGTLLYVSRRNMSELKRVITENWRV